MEISTWLYFLGLLNEKILLLNEFDLYSLYIAIDFFLENKSFFISDTLLTLLFLAYCHYTVRENEIEFVNI